MNTLLMLFFSFSTLLQGNPDADEILERVLEV